MTNTMKRMPKENEYLDLLYRLKKRIQEAQIKAVTSVNKELVFLYLEIGNNILERQTKEGWGSKVIERLSRDLAKSFPNMHGFSPRNLKYMRKFAEEYPKLEIVQEPLAQLTWYHNITLMEKIQFLPERMWLYK